MYLGALAAVANQGIAYKNIYTLFSTKVFRLLKKVFKWQCMLRKKAGMCNDKHDRVIY